MRMLPVCMYDGSGGSEGGFVCFVSIFQQRWEEVVDAGLIPAKQSKLQALTAFSGPLSPSLSILFSWFQCQLPPIPLTEAHIHTSLSALLGLARKDHFSAPVYSSAPVCLLPEASGTPGPELPLLLSSPLFFSPSPLFGCYVSSLFPGLFI